MILSPIDESLLAEIANIHGMPKGAFNIRKDGQLVERHSSANIEIATKTDNPGIDIRIKAGTKGETVYIPVIVTQAGLKDVVYNTFYIEDDCDVTIIAGCGIHNDEPPELRARRHPHVLAAGRTRRVKYVETPLRRGRGHRRAHPQPRDQRGDGGATPSCEMELTQTRAACRPPCATPNAELGAGAKLVLTEKLLTHGRPGGHLEHEGGAQGRRLQRAGDLALAWRRTTPSRCSTRSSSARRPAAATCSAMPSSWARPRSRPSPASRPRSEDAHLVHEAAIGKIAGDQIIEAHDARTHRGGGRAGNPRGLPELTASPHARHAKRFPERLGKSTE